MHVWVQIVYECNITKIDRHLDEKKKPIQVFCTIGDNKEIQTIEADFLIFAAPLQQLPKVVSGLTPFEKKAVSHQTSVGLAVHLLKTAKKPKTHDVLKHRWAGETALTFYPESLMEEYTPTPDGQGTNRWPTSF